MGAFSYKCFLKIKLRGAFRMKKTLKKISAASLVVILSITLAACGGGNKTAATSESEVAVESTVETVEGSSEESSEIVEERKLTVEELLDIYNGPGDLAGSAFEAAIKKRDMGEIVQSISTEDVISVVVEENSIEDQVRGLDIRVIDENMSLLYWYFYRDDYFFGSILEQYKVDVGKVNATAGSFDVLEQKATEIGNFLDYWDYTVGENVRPGKMRGGMSPFARIFEHDSSSTSAYARLLVAYKGLVERLYNDGNTPPNILIQDDDVKISTFKDYITIDQHNRIVKNSAGQVIATGATIESEPRKEFNAFVFDNESQVQIVIDALEGLYPETEPLF